MGVDGHRSLHRAQRAWGRMVRETVLLLSALGDAFVYFYCLLTDVVSLPGAFSSLGRLSSAVVLGLRAYGPRISSGLHGYLEPSLLLANMLRLIASSSAKSWQSTASYVASTVSTSLPGRLTPPLLDNRDRLLLKACAYR
jgi:hypothetical protein